MTSGRPCYANEAERKAGQRQAVDRYQARNRDKVLAARRSHYHANADAYADNHRRYVADNRDAVREYNAAYRKAHPEMIHNSGQRRKGHRGRLSAGFVEMRLHEQCGLCPVCLANLIETGFHFDHISPVSKGGAHCDANVWLLCPTCNLRKNAKPLVKFLAQVYD